MFVLGNLLKAIAIILDQVFNIYSFVLLVAVLITWVSPDPFNPIVRFLRMATEPLFNLIRRLMPFVTVGMLDLSPMVAILLIWFIRLFLVNTLFDLSNRLR